MQPSDFNRNQKKWKLGKKWPVKIVNSYQVKWSFNVVKTTRKKWFKCTVKTLKLFSCTGLKNAAEYKFNSGF